MADEDILHRVKDLEAQIARLEQQTDIGGNVEKLQERIQVLETTRAVVFAIAVIFGAAGAWGLGMIQTARAQLNTVETGRSAITDSVTADAKSQLRDYSNSVLQGTLVLGDPDDGCFQIKDFQICWGKKIADAANDQMNRKFDFTFKNPFTEIPVVAEGIDGGQNNSGHPFAVYSSTPSRVGYSGNLTETKSAQTTEDVWVSYLAVGKWK